MAQKLMFASTTRQLSLYVIVQNAYLLCHVSPLNLEDQILLQIWQLI